MLAIALAIAVTLAAEPAPAPPQRFVNTTGKTALRKLERANDVSVVVISRAGTSVAFDPRSGAVPADVTALTHDHQVEEHVTGEPRWKYYRTLRGDEPGVLVRPGRTAVKDVVLTGIAASHYGKEITSPPDYVIWLLEADGLRIAYFPCIVQETFTPEQRAALGRVDVAIFNAEDDRDGRRNVRSFNLARQLRPSVLIPLTHGDGSYELALGQIEDLGARIVTQNDPLLLGKDELAGLGERVVDLMATAAMP